MGRIDGTAPARRRRALIAVTAGAVVFAALAVPGWIARSMQPASSAAAFPSEIASYAWWTPPLAGGDIDTAVMAYQNGYGVEFLDTPQAILLGTDGSTYRRHAAAESLAGVADQGDPAESVLSPDGSLLVTAGLDGSGVVTVTTLATGATAEVPIGEGLDAIPVSIDRTGSVLLTVSESPLSPYLDQDFRLHGRLALLDLESGELTEYAAFPDVASAALSPDGSRIAVDSVDGLVVADIDGSDVVDVLPAGTSVSLDGDAWSPDGSRFAVYGGDGLTVADVSRRDPVVTSTGADPALVGSVIGWRDADTVLLHTTDTSGSNESAFSWADVSDGRLDTFSTYTPDVTGAALGGPDVARDLVETLEARPLPVDRGGGSTLFALATGLVVGLVAWLVAPPLLSRIGGGRRVGLGAESRRRAAHDEAGLQLDARG